jgi:hypothetical protein
MIISYSSNHNYSHFYNIVSENQDKRPIARKICIENLFRKVILGYHLYIN